LVESPFQQKFGNDKRDTLPRYCRECDVRFLCHGECPKNRFLLTPDGEEGLNWLCSGLKRFFHHIAPTMEWMAQAFQQGRPPAGVMEVLKRSPSLAPPLPRAAAAQPTRNATPPTPVAPGRNDPCPCGSGRKYKRCCGA
ncbi:MAG: SEC-C metal-binding domain-containing protein, partial [Armatimonadota bacterium]|nr:SEC-C metal-binding domain-containing protein [Armatimonadota bacterium]